LSGTVVLVETRMGGVMVVPLLSSRVSALASLALMRLLLLMLSALLSVVCRVWGCTTEVGGEGGCVRRMAGDGLSGLSGQGVTSGWTSRLTSKAGVRVHSCSGSLLRTVLLVLLLSTVSARLLLLLLAAMSKS
jgi:hypothetical protein